MGKLSLNSKSFNSIIFKPFESREIMFKGPIGTTIGNFINTFDIYNVDGNGIVNMYIGNLDTLSITFLSDGSDWLNVVTEQNVSNYVIPLNAIFQINSTSNIPVSLNLGGNASNYVKGKTDINKKNLSTLIPFQVGIDVYPNNRYIFKSATTNLLGTVFNPSLFNSQFQDILNIYVQNEGQRTFYFNGSIWVGDDFSTPANNYIIPNNSIIEITTNDITSVPVGGGAVIQKYSSGKTTIPIAGIPVSSTNTITINDSYQNLTDIVLTKINATTYKAIVDIDFDGFGIGGWTIFCDEVIPGFTQGFVNVYSQEINLIKEGSYWIYKYVGAANCMGSDENVYSDRIVATVQEQTPGYIPVKGWVLQNGINGNITLKKSSAIPLNTSNITINNGPSNAPWGIGNAGPCGNDFRLSTNQNGIWSQGHLSCDFFVGWDDKGGALPYRWRFWYNNDGRTDYASHPTAKQGALPSEGWSNGMTISII
jgi:hypothetical protein